MNRALCKKYKRLKEIVHGHGRVIIAFSGGLDSGLLVKVAHDTMGEKAAAVTIHSSIRSQSDYVRAMLIARDIGIAHKVILTDELSARKFVMNQSDRCYWCKRIMFAAIKKQMRYYACGEVCDGTLYDDQHDSRQGLKANKEFGVKSPLYEAGFTKEDAVCLARFLKLSLWNQPAEACLASRISPGRIITNEKLRKIEDAERLIKQRIGKLCLVRARDHNDILRIELEKRHWTKLKTSDITKLAPKLKRLGYKYITFDWEGYIPAGKR